MGVLLLKEEKDCQQVTWLLAIKLPLTEIERRGMYC
jgi:hypothetical protein